MPKRKISKDILTQNSNHMQFFQTPSITTKWKRLIQWLDQIKSPKLVNQFIDLLWKVVMPFHQKIEVWSAKETSHNHLLHNTDNQQLRALVILLKLNSKQRVRPKMLKKPKKLLRRPPLKLNKKRIPRKNWQKILQS